MNIKNRWGYVIAFGMLLLVYFLVFFVIRKLEKDATSVSHSYSIIHNLESIKAEITGAETGARGYVVTGDLGLLKPYNAGSKQARYLIDELRKLTQPKVEYQARVDSLGRLIDAKLDELSGLIARFQRDGNPALSVIPGTFTAGQLIMDKIRSVVKSMSDQEQALMNVRNEKLKEFFQTMAIMAIVSLVITLFTVFYSLVTHNKENRAREEADNKARVYRMELEGRVNELNRLNVELGELKSIEKFAASGRMARTIAHEVRNPLTNISLASEQLKETATPNEDTEMLLGMIDRSVNRINQLVSDLLYATRMEQLEYAPADINLLLNEALGQAQDRIELKHIRVEKKFDAAIPQVVVDREKMKLAFLNIIVNAVEAMKNDTGVLELRTDRQDGKCLIEFSDNGAGMDEEIRQKLFEPYFTSKAKGNGLGLTHTQNIILSHKGNINVKSTPGKGSTFIVTLNLN